MILCDTNVLIEFLKGNSAVVAELQSLGTSQLAISVITAAELYYGALNKAELRSIKLHLGAVTRVPIDTAASQTFIDLMEQYALSHKLSIPDALIAATALVQGMDLYTFNARDFRFIANLRLHQAQIDGT